MATFQNSSSVFKKSTTNFDKNNNVPTLSNPFTYNVFNATTETLDLDTVDDISLDDKVTKKNIFAMISLINDGYEKQKTNFSTIKKYAEEEKKNLDDKFNNLVRPNTKPDSDVPEEEAGVSEKSDSQQTKINTIETLTNDKYKDLSEFFQKYHENKKQTEINQNMTAPGESGNKDYQNKVNLMDEFVKANFDVNNVEELEKKYNEINSTIFNAEQSVEFIDHCKETTKYDLISKLDDYQNYKPEVANDFTTDNDGDDIYYKYNGNKNPFETLKEFRKTHKSEDLEGIDDNLYILYEASLANPELGKLYSYIYDTECKTAADKYIKDMEDDINKIAGEKQAAEFLNSLDKKDKSEVFDAIKNHLKVGGKGLDDGIESYFEGLKAWFSTSDKRTASDYEKMYIMQALMSETDKEDAGLITRDENNNYTSNIESSSVIKKYQIDYTKDYAGEYLSDNYQISQGIGNMLPSILLSTVSPVAGSISMGVSAGGNSYHQALIEGQSVMKSLFYGVVSGASEATLEKFMGGIPGLSDVSVTSFKTFAQTIVKEGIEEGTQAYTDALLRTGIFGEEFKLDEATKDAIKSGIYGMLTAGILNTPSLIKVKVNDVVQNHNSNVNSENTGGVINEEYIYNKLVDFGYINSNDTTLNLSTVMNDVELMSKNYPSVSLETVLRFIGTFNEGTSAAQGKYYAFFKGFREHALQHTNLVAEYAMNLAKGNSSINMDEIMYAALCHDLGMKGGYSLLVDKTGNYSFVKVDESVDLQGNDLNNLPEEISLKLANAARKNHPLNSALAVLTTEGLIPDSINKNIVALLAMSHSKSTSGIQHFSSPEEWITCIDKLDQALTQYNKDNGTNYEFDKEGLLDMVNNPEEFARLQDQALAIRDGDAMSDVAVDEAGNTIMQTNTSSEIIFGNKRTNYNDPIAGDYKQELKEEQVQDIYHQVDKEDVLNDNDFSMKIHVGEANVNFSSTYSNKNYSASVTLKDPNSSPNCTFDAITERIEEVATYDNCKSREFVIKLPEEAKGTELDIWYKNKLTEYKNIMAGKFEKNNDNRADFFDSETIIRIEYE